MSKNHLGVMPKARIKILVVVPGQCTYYNKVAYKHLSDYFSYFKPSHIYISLSIFLSFSLPLSLPLSLYIYKYIIYIIYIIDVRSLILGMKMNEGPWMNYKIQLFFLVEQYGTHVVHEKEAVIYDVIVSI